MEEIKDLSEIYFLVGFLNFFFVQQLEKMYENLNKNLNKDKSYCVFFFWNNVQKMMVDCVFQNVFGSLYVIYKFKDVQWYIYMLYVFIYIVFLGNFIVCVFVQLIYLCIVLNSNYFSR